jgi:hypothetical protein
MSPIEKKIHTKPAASISAYLAESDVLHYSLVAKGNIYGHDVP